nr:RsiV family protein [Thalassobacillus sp. CUG 92003]
MGFPIFYYGETEVVKDIDFYSVLLTSNISWENHYQSQVKSFNFFNKPEATIATLEELTNFEKLTEEVKRELAKDPEVYNVKDFKTLREDTAYYLKDGDIVLVFNKYEIAPGVYGNPEITIPYSRVKAKMPKVQENEGPLFN